MSRQLEIERMVDEVGHQIQSFDPSNFTVDAAESESDDAESGFDPSAVGLGGGKMAIDVVDEGDQFTVTADLPGYAREDIDVCLKAETTLYISAESASEATTETGASIRRERHHESIQRSVTLPEPVDNDETEATYDNGVLTVTLRKLQAADIDGQSIPVN